MIYEITLNEKHYGIDVGENIVFVLNTDENKRTNQKKRREENDFISDLPDFNFDENKNNSIVYSTMQGKIITINVVEGQKVMKNEILAILESMKMEVNVVACEDGFVRKININVGDFVKMNSKMFLINKVI